MSLSMQDLTFGLKVKDKVIETPTAVSFVLEIPQPVAERFIYKPGQFVSLSLIVNGETISRSYSLSTSPLTDEEFKITVKRVSGGKGSNFLIDQVQIGDELRVTPPAGLFYKPTMDNRHYVFFAAGSGITPVFSILKSVLFANEQNIATLVYCNKNPQEVIYRNELEHLTKKYGERLRVVHIFSQSNEGDFHGRLDNAKMQSIWTQVQRSHLNQEIYLCGPETFMDIAQNYLSDNGLVTETQIHRESFAIELHNPKVHEKPQDGIFIGDQTTYGPPEKLLITLNGEQHELDYDGESSILENLINQGIDAPYSCMDGACMACLGKIKQGLVSQEDYGVITEDNIDDKECLTCQAKPQSQLVHVDYDEL